MNAEVPKVLLDIAGQPVLGHVIRAARDGGAERVVVIIGPDHETVRRAFEAPLVEFAVQAEPRGTADALLAARPLMGEDEDCVVLCGDAPLIKGSTIARLRQQRRESGADASVLSAVLDDPAGYGRIVRGTGGNIAAIVEERDADAATLAIREVNSGAYSFVWGRVRPLLEGLGPSPVTGEYYLTDAVRAVCAAGGVVVAVTADSPEEVMGINTPEQFASVEEILVRSGATRS